MDKIFNFKTLVSFSALAIAGCAALFSVTGIGTLFAGAAVSAMVMASALELGKLVGVSFLYRYWSEIPKALKSYMLVASITLIGITSAGIYGYLSSAYAKVAAEPLKMNADIQIYNSQAQTLDEEIKRKTARLDQIISLRGQQENRIDNLISKSTTGSSSAVRLAQNSLNELNRTATTLQREINQTSAQRDSLKARSLTKEVEINTNSDIGTFVYISKAIGVELDTVVKWFILIIVLVFDPLSICLVLAYNFLTKREEKVEDKTYKIYGETLVTEEQIKETTTTHLPTLPEDLLTRLNSDDPFPQYMTKQETEDVLDTFWKKKTISKYKDINLF